MIKELTKEQKNQIINALKLKGVKYVCPMCGNQNFILAGGYFGNILQIDLKIFSLGGSGIPTVPIVCSNCGFVSQHALGVLGLLPKEENDQNKNDTNK